MFVVDDLEAAARRLQARYGLRCVPGGRHEGHGTANGIVPLGRDYLELLAVVDPLEAAESPIGRWAGEQAARAAGDLRLAALCLRTDDLEAVAERLGTKPVPMTRTTPEDVTLSWRLAGLDSAMTESLPFFITWDGPPEAHPGRVLADHDVDVDGISWVEVGGDEALLWRRLGQDRVAVRPVGGPPGYGRLCLDSAGGPLVLGPGAG